MNATSEQQAVQTAPLERAMNWIRSRLERTAQNASAGGDGSTSSVEAPRVTAAMVAAADTLDSTSPLGLLAERFQLTNFEYAVLLLCLAMELDTSVPGLCARAQRDVRRPYPTFALALTMFDDASWDALSPERPLRFWRLIELDPVDTLSLTARSLRIDERVLSFVNGVHHVDARWLPLLEALDDRSHGSHDFELPSSQQDIVAALVRRMGAPPREGVSPAVQLVGRDAQSAQLVASRVARALGRKPYRLRADLLPSGTSELDLLLRLWQRETLLGPVALYIDAHGVTEAHGATLERFIARAPGVAFVGTREPRGAGERTCAMFEVNKPTAAERRALWIEQLGPEASAIAERLSGQFELDPVAIQSLAAFSPRDAHGALDESSLWQSCVDATVPRVEGTAHRIRPRAAWDDLVLPPSELSALHEIAAQVNNRATVYDTWGFGSGTQRGLALTAVFFGESGTGKTLAAEVLASELGLQLLVIDLSSVVSKYIGETEKNLRRVFDGAEDSGAILFFDEADALFGKRSEVRDSHDRYANVEISYLLQRMEAYRGLAILATNMKSALDPAFMRRLRFFVRFSFPGARERAAIWRRVFPPEAPLGVLDFDRLATFALTGGSIRNISLNAAFLAAHARSPITMPLVLAAIRTELHKLERRVSEAEFRWQDTRAPSETLREDTAVAR